MNHLPLAVLALSGALSTVLSAQVELDRLTVQNASTFSAFGSAVALSGDVMVVGASDDAVPQNYTGSVFVFRRSNGNWVQEQKLTASNGGLLHEFGRSVAIDGNVIVVGAPAPITSSFNGAAYVFRFDGSQWNEEQILLPAGDWIGWDVDIEGDRIVVGAMYTDLPGAAEAGAAWVYDFDGTTWNATQRLTASDHFGHDLFGSAVGLSGNTILVGARGESDNGLQLYYIGAVYSFDLTPSGWVETQKFRANLAEEQAQFGSSLAIDGDVAVIGAPAKNYREGAAYFVHRQGGTWVEDAKVLSPWPGYNHYFGLNLDLAGDLALIADLGRDMNGNPGGTVFAYRFDGSAWLDEPSFQGSHTVSGSGFGQAVALDGTAAAVTSWETNSNAVDGAAYLFDMAEKFHLMLSPLPLQADEDATFSVRHAPANTAVLLTYSFAGPGSFPIPGLGLTLGLALPQSYGLMITNGTGLEKIESHLLPVAAGIDIWMQALHLGAVTNVIATGIR
ncbi:MAG: FG-GAP repeat protein [Planctomycetes bacterium]|nr:FG-GAP repeat protein [Planctomycetota bacterium]